MLHFIVNGQYDYVLFDQTLPLELRITDGNFDSSIHVGGYTPIAGFEYSINGSGGDDTIIMQLTGDGLMNGGRGNDILQGGPGNERLVGSEGDDEIRGGPGNDELEGWKGMDFIYGEEGEDILYGDEDSDFLFGGRGRDVLNGGQANDTLMGSDPVGHNGQDPIATADGEFDELWGDSGADNYVYSFYDWVGSGFFKRRQEREFDLLMDYAPNQGDNLLQAEIATVDIFSVFR